MESIIKDLIKIYNLVPLDHEGGYFFRALGDDLPFSVIYYLMTKKSFSALHLLTVHEIWTFISGDPIEQITIGEEKKVHHTYIGEKGVDIGLSHVLPNIWQGTRIKEGGQAGYALCTTTCVPGYRQEDFLLATKEILPQLVSSNDLPFVREFLAP